MNTRQKNKSAHPGIPDMTPSQLTSAGLSHAQDAHRPSKKKLTKDQQIAALRDELRVTRELVVSNNRSEEVPMDTGGDTDPGTDVEEFETAVVGTKRKVSSGTAGSTSKLKRSRAIDPFEFSSMVHPGATGLVDNWRTKITPPPGTPSPRSFTFNFQTPDRNTMSPSPMSSRTMSSISTPRDSAPNLPTPKNGQGHEGLPRD
ncbi:hypothetical protein BDM02DRAFT_3133127 [Thelephora ganbajun]|uniref:Uncharacterized protein n=1 Tax=Thelephora ganbajun TaxID=370292 RepID=A0ACB6YZ84_THEGA|nr:hypothetical protein BDM02DRAFT_3133127 [Thelephora ganbajun]